MSTDAQTEAETAGGESPGGESLSGESPGGESLSAVAARVPEPQSLEETGLSPQLLMELAAKTMYYRGQATEGDLGEWLRLGRRAVDRLVEAMKRDGLVEALTQVGLLQFRYALSEKGRQRAIDAFERDQYMGPAPVAFEDYVALQSEQSVRALEVASADIERALAGLVQPSELVAAIGAGIVSAGAVLLYGPSGNGKSSVAAAIREMLREPMAIPHALELGGRIMRLFDAAVHEELPDAEGLSHDRRFAICHRPMVTLGTELTLDDLVAVYSETDHTYTAPPQLKAAGGVLVVDDLGRQGVQPVELLNRWMAPMATGVDQLGLKSGGMLRVPFDVLLVFATNLEPSELGDEAFLRRIRHKVLIPDPTRAEYIEIFHRAAEARGIPFEQESLDVILSEYYVQDGRPLRGSHPGDLLENVVDFARVDGVEPRMSAAALRRACDAYFVR